MAEENVHGKSAADATLDHMVEEIREIEGVGKRRWPKWLAIFLVLAGAVAVVWFAQNPSALPRGPKVDEGAVIAISSPGYGKLSVPPRTFKWQSVAGRHHYTLTIGTAEGKSDVLEKMVMTDSIVLNDAETQVLQRGSTYYWKVRAYSKDGKIIGHAASKFAL
jgi:hypothetical protein